MNIVLETNKQMLAALNNLSFQMISSVLYDEDFGDILREEVADSICDREESYEHPDLTWD